VELPEVASPAGMSQGTRTRRACRRAAARPRASVRKLQAADTVMMSRTDLVITVH